uniref:CRIB domain-containing protein n=1 Tax=Fagus sylvatica TaxID=28930 RepID=A0A2N9G289_FAGSY
MSNHKMKGLLKGLRYISQIFDNEKEPEMQIGFPTDVKHVAHIGWDGPSMNEFKAPPGFSSAPLSLPGDINEDSGVKWVSEDSNRRSTRTPNSPARDLPEVPRSSRRHSSSSAVTGSPSREKTDKPRQSRRPSKSSKDSADDSKLSRLPMVPSSSLGSVSPSHSLPDIPKKSRRKKSNSKDCSAGGSTRASRLKAQAPEPYQSPFSDPGPVSGSVSTPMNNEVYQKSFEEGPQKGYAGMF